MAIQPTILVTGATGLLGSHLLFALLEKGYCVRAFARSQSNTAHVKSIFDFYTSGAAALWKQVEWFEGDLEDPTSVALALEGITHVYHCAAMVSFRPKDAELMLATNRKTTENLVNLALERKVQHFCHVSSVASLGRDKNGGLIDESRIWTESSENSNYALSKYHAEMEVWRGIEEGLPAVIVNPGIILGPGFWDSGSSHFFKAIYKGFPFTSDGINGFVDVRDVAAILMQLSANQVVNERFILVSENISYDALFQMIAKHFNKKHPHIKPKGWVLQFFGRLEYWRSVLLGSYPLVTKETARTAQRQNRYSNEKIRKLLPNFSFRTLRTTTQDFCGFFENSSERIS
jgi:dihydroflavonol-4-reductase